MEADFGEDSPTTRCFLGARSEELHDRYARNGPEEPRAISEAGRDDDIVFFNRSGYTKSPATHPVWS